MKELSRSLDLNPVISSSDNPAIKQFRSLCRQNQGAAERVVILEGFRAVEDALLLGHRPELVLLRDNAEIDDSSALREHQRTIRRVRAQLFDRLAETQHPQGVLAAFRLPRFALKKPDNTLSLVADNVRDPGNLGTMMRSAAAADFDRFYCTRGTANFCNRKVVRAGMGAHLRLPVFILESDSDFDQLQQDHDQLVISDLQGSLPYDKIDFSASTAIVIGGETEGVSQAILDRSDVFARIPMPGTIESLNAGSAAAVFLFEAQRQRRPKE